MAKEMSHDLNDENTDDVASRVLTTKRSAAPLASLAGEPPLKSGVGKIEQGAHLNHLPPRPSAPRPLPAPPPRARARVPAPVAPQTPPTEDSDAHSSEKTQVYRPPLVDSPVARPSARPTVRPAVEVPRAASAVSTPTPARVPSGITNLQLRPATNVSEPECEAEEDRTRVCPAAVIEGLLQKEDRAAASAASSNAADDVTRVGEIAIEELVMAERQLADASDAVGHEDVTRSYSFTRNDTPSQVTAPSMRQQRMELKYEPLVIVQPDRPARKARILLVALLLFGTCAGASAWMYRSTLHRYYRASAASFMRGINAATAYKTPARNVPAAPAAPAAINISISVSPADAVLTIDGAPVSNPFLAKRPPDGASHQLKVEATGYVSLQRQIQFDRDLTVVMALAPLPVSRTIPTELAKAPEQPSSATSPAVKAVTHTTAQKPVVKPTTPASDGTQNSCTPPYLIDSKGIKTFKPECL